MKNFVLDEYLRLVEELVNIDSGSRVRGGPAKVAAKMAELYRALGLSVQVLDGDNEYGPRLEIRSHPEREEIDLLLSGHMDTVFAGGTAAERPFRAENGRGYGPGVMDMKAGLVSMYYLVRALTEEKTDLSFCVALNSDEEISSLRSRDWIAGLARKSAYAFVMEPGRKNGEYVSERKGLARYQVTMKGIAAHAGIAPQDGASAIHEMAHFITEIIALNAYDRGTSVNVGVISGGNTANVVCDLAECQIDTRFDDIGESQKIEAKLEALKQAPRDSRVSISVTRAGFRPPMRATDKTTALLEQMKAEGERLGMEVKWVKTGGGSDGNFIAFEGCTVVDGMGPAGEGAHSSNEVLHIDTIEKRLELAFNMARELERQKKKALN